MFRSLLHEQNVLIACCVRHWLYVAYVSVITIVFVVKTLFAHASSNILKAYQSTRVLCINSYVVFIQRAGHNNIDKKM